MILNGYTVSQRPSRKTFDCGAQCQIRYSPQLKSPSTLPCRSCSFMKAIAPAGLWPSSRRRLEKRPVYTTTTAARAATIHWLVPERAGRASSSEAVYSVAPGESRLAPEERIRGEPPERIDV